MNEIRLSRYAMGALSAAMLSACGAPASPAGMPAPSNPALARSLLSAMLDRPRAAHARQRGQGSWISLSMGHSDLIYVSNSGEDKVTMYSWPAFKPVGKLAGFDSPAGVCSDPQGDVWVVNEASSVLERFPHGSLKRMGKLSDGQASYPLGCAVDPTTGNLAVTDLGGSTGGGQVLIYAGAQGKATAYSYSAMSYFYFCTYDSSGNLFVDGLDNNYNFVLAELPSGGTTFESIGLSGTIGFPGGLVWNNGYLTIGDQAYSGKHESAIDEVSVSGSAGTIEGTAVLGSSCDVMQFAMANTSADTSQSQIAVAPDACLNDVSLYAYPSGGNPIKTRNKLQYPIAATLSVPAGI